jgi:uncharacterized protein (TIGR02246 family)
MSRALRVVCPMIVSLLIAAPVFAQGSDPAMEKLRSDYEQAWKNGDAKALATLYTEDCLSVNQFGVVTRGRAGIEKLMTENFAGPYKGSTIAIKLGAAQAVTPDIAVGEGTYSVLGAGPDGKPMTWRGHYVNTLIKKGNAWLIAGNTGFVPQRPPAAAKPAAKTN